MEQDWIFILGIQPCVPIGGDVGTFENSHHTRSCCESVEQLKKNPPRKG